MGLFCDIFRCLLDSVTGNHDFRAYLVPQPCQNNDNASILPFFYLNLIASSTSILSFRFLKKATFHNSRCKSKPFASLRSSSSKNHAAKDQNLLFHFVHQRSLCELKIISFSLNSWIAVSCFFVYLIFSFLNCSSPV